MHAEQMAEDFPIVRSDSNALDAVRLLAEHRLPGLVVTDDDGVTSILPAAQVVRLLVPNYVQDDPSLAGVLSESMADRIGAKLGSKTVAAVLPKHREQLPAVDADDTLVEVAAVMARSRSPLVVVVSKGTLVGVITSSRLLEIALQGC